ncbi:hypothetical protein [Flammeovirga aprica]|uniref:STAS/SEC14 domain-containing protein n=1 Tax=Flammeovirga aprica JL-4 TaxID=694437 RepID=A0A7X9XAR4_9BACT|nr:hypothetical protein [Flammeovirga aprica]NME69884.1 hypothetical protein [Flammeovirga aprica JL-4]
MQLKNHYHCNFCDFDLEDFPIIKVTTNVTEPTLADVQEYQVLKKEIFAAIDQKVVLIFDPSSVKWMPADARIALGEGVKHSEKHYSHIIQKAYMVIPNLVLNILFKGVVLVSNTSLKYSIHRSYDEAYRCAFADMKSLAA